MANALAEGSSIQHRIVSHILLNQLSGGQSHHHRLIHNKGKKFFENTNDKDCVRVKDKQKWNFQRN